MSGRRTESAELIAEPRRGSVPSMLTISAVVLTLQTAVVLATGELWLVLLQFPLANLCMCVLFVRAASGPDPLVARLAAEVLALRQPDTRHPDLHASSRARPGYGRQSSCCWRPAWR
jgi:hypothetical protein